MILEQALTIAKKVKSLIEPMCIPGYCEIAGSVRRREKEIGDIEIVCVRKSSELIRMKDLIDSWTRIRGDVTGKNAQRVYCFGPDKEKDIVVVDIYFVQKENWGYHFVIRTGSREFSKRVAGRWVHLGYKGSEGWLTKDGKNIIIPTEQALFDLLRLPWVDPEGRK